MKLVMFKQGNDRRMGLVRDGEVIDVAALAASMGSQPPPGDILSLIEAGEPALTRIRELASSRKAQGEGVVHRLGDLTLLPPLDPPRGNVIAIGRNYQKHAEEGARAWGEQVRPPTVFTKAQLSITGPQDDIAIDPAISDKIDWEVELGVVVGRRGVNIKAPDAMRHVFGYTVINDVSARDIQNGWGGQFFKGKSLDRSSPVGPFVVTADEIPDPQALRLTLRVNGQVKQDGSTADMIYSVQDLIVWLSIG
ncbi:MAG TPA: fumarylacetoacetate hydrolase family protein, partial [Candidatus Limnocylindrales bacterium]|nr:fumarylacetoacetate hydrolase family protein [Candidatus Limnocylindrales bacterium]